MLGSKPTKPMIYGRMLLKRHRRGCMAPFVCEIVPGLGGACGRWEEVEEVSMLNHLLSASCTCLCCTVLSMPGSFIVRICPISRPAILLPVYLGQYYITAPQACSNIFKGTSRLVISHCSKQSAKSSANTLLRRLGIWLKHHRKIEISGSEFCLSTEAYLRFTPLSGYSFVAKSIPLYLPFSLKMNSPYICHIYIS